MRIPSYRRKSRKPNDKLSAKDRKRLAGYLDPNSNFWQETLEKKKVELIKMAGDDAETYIDKYWPDGYGRDAKEAVRLFDLAIKDAAKRFTEDRPI